MIELFKTTRASMNFERMIPSGSSWLMGLRVQRIFDLAHDAMEPGKTIFISKFNQITGHTGEHLLKPPANYMKLKVIGNDCHHVKFVQKPKSDKEIYQRRK